MTDTSAPEGSGHRNRKVAIGGAAVVAAAVMAVVVGLIVSSDSHHTAIAVRAGATPSVTTVPVTAPTTPTTVCVPVEPAITALVGPIKCDPDFIHNIPTPDSSDAQTTIPPVQTLPPPATVPIQVASCPSGSGSGNVNVTFNSKVFADHCYYASSGRARVTFTDHDIEPTSGQVIPVTLTISPASDPEFGAVPIDPRTFVDNPANIVASSPYALDSTPVTFTLPHLTAGTYDLFAQQEPGPPAVLRVEGS